MGIYEIITIIILSIITSVVVLNLIIILKKDKTSVKKELEEQGRDIKDSLKSEIDHLSNNITLLVNQSSQNQLEQNKLVFQSIGAMMSQLSDSQSKSNIEIEQKLENIRKSVETSINTLKENTDTRLENVRKTIEDSLTKIQVENSKKLEEMRQTVDEKLQTTLNARITESFKTVSESLERVTKGLGEMQNLATGVGDLKKVLTNVKTRGTFGEILLSNILDEILIPEQYESNFATDPNRKERVEFAIKLPGDGDSVYLPIDSKFPLDDYNRLLDAYEEGDTEKIEKFKKDLTNSIKKFAKDISSKYINVPRTTEFAIMFLPVEGLYAEVVRYGLIEELQRDYRINIAGPTTMAALLNSIQMGFRSLAIQKRSDDVWKTLATVKKEFETFGTVLEAAQRKITQANTDLERLVGTRTRSIQRSLKEVEEFIDYGPKKALPEDIEKE